MFVTYLFGLTFGLLLSAWKCISNSLLIFVLNKDSNRRIAEFTVNIMCLSINALFQGISGLVFGAIRLLAFYKGVNPVICSIPPILIFIGVSLETWQILFIFAQRCLAFSTRVQKPSRQQIKTVHLALLFLSIAVIVPTILSGIKHDQDALYTTCGEDILGYQFTVSGVIAYFNGVPSFVSFACYVGLRLKLTKISRQRKNTLRMEQQRPGDVSIAFHTERQHPYPRRFDSIVQKPEIFQFETETVRGLPRRHVVNGDQADIGSKSKEENELSAYSSTSNGTYRVFTLSNIIVYQPNARRMPSVQEGSTKPTEEIGKPNATHDKDSIENHQCPQTLTSLLTAKKDTGIYSANEQGHQIFSSVLSIKEDIAISSTNEQGIQILSCMLSSKEDTGIALYSSIEQGPQTLSSVLSAKEGIAILSSNKQCPRTSASALSTKEDIAISPSIEQGPQTSAIALSTKKDIPISSSIEQGPQTSASVLSAKEDVAILSSNEQCPQTSASALSTKKDIIISSSNEQGPQTSASALSTKEDMAISPSNEQGPQTSESALSRKKDIAISSSNEQCPQTSASALSTKEDIAISSSNELCPLTSASALSTKEDIAISSSNEQGPQTSASALATKKNIVISSSNEQGPQTSASALFTKEDIPISSSNEQGPQTSASALSTKKDIAISSSNEQCPQTSASTLSIKKDIAISSSNEQGPQTSASALSTKEDIAISSSNEQCPHTSASVISTKEDIAISSKNVALVKTELLGKQRKKPMNFNDYRQPVLEESQNIKENIAHAHRTTGKNDKFPKFTKSTVHAHEQALKTMKLFLLLNTSLPIQFFIVWHIFLILPESQLMYIITIVSMSMLYLNSSLNLFVIVSRYPQIREAAFKVLRKWRCSVCQNKVSPDNSLKDH